MKLLGGSLRHYPAPVLLPLPSYRPCAVDFGGAEFHSLRPLLDAIGFRADLFIARTDADPAPLLEAALSFCSEMGEGVLLGQAGALLGHPLRRHCWAALDVGGQSVLYFAKGHTTGVQWRRSAATLQEAESLFVALAHERGLREGAEVREYLYTANTLALWDGAIEESSGRVRLPPNPHLALDRAGRLSVCLSTFDRHSGRIPPEDAAFLFALNGQHPAQVVMNRVQRRELQRLVSSSLRVDPALPSAIASAVAHYETARAPLSPLPPIQRLGYADEWDRLECSHDLCSEGRTLFRAGGRYSIRTRLVRVLRQGQRTNLDGVVEELELAAKELAILLTAEDGREYCFMEARLRADDVTLDGVSIDFTLQQLVEVFIVPQVPDVAELNPEGYLRNLQLLQQIESLCR